MKKISTLLIVVAVFWIIFLISPVLFVATLLIGAWLFDDTIADFLWKKKEDPEPEPEYDCEICNDTGLEEIMGDGENFEWDVIGYKRCRCQRDLED